MRFYKKFSFDKVLVSRLITIEGYLFDESYNKEVCKSSKSECYKLEKSQLYPIDILKTLYRILNLIHFIHFENGH
jgi:hypothetical protein